MGLLPNLDIGLDIKATVQEFLVLLRDIRDKLDTLIEIERAAQVEQDEEGPALTLVPAEDVEDDLEAIVVCGRPLGAGHCEQIMAHPGRCE